MVYLWGCLVRQVRGDMTFGVEYLNKNKHIKNELV